MVIRVLHIFHEMANGGVSSFVMNNYRQIDKTRIQFDFLTAVNEDGYFDNEIHSLGGRTFKVCPVEKNPIKHYQEIERIVAENNYQIVHRHTGSAFGYFDLRAARKGGAKHLILHSHNPEAGNMFLHRVSKRILKIDCLKLACSNDSGIFLFGKNESFIVINNTIDCDRFKFDQSTREKVRKQLNISDDFVIGNIGRFEKQKNHEKLIGIFNEFHKHNPHSKLICVGEGFLLPQIKDLVHSLGVDDAVIYTGNIENVEEVIQSFDVFCFPSLYEGFGITLIEAQANGLKCYASKDKIPQEANITGNVSFIPLSKTNEEWAGIILNSDNSRDFSALDTIKEKGFDLSNGAKKLTNLYEKLYFNEQN